MMPRLRPHVVLTALVCTLGLPRVSSAQMGDYISPSLLRQVMPRADRFSEKIGEPAVMQAYRAGGSSGSETLIGYVFLTSDVPPEPFGYSGPVEALVGMDLEGNVTGVRVMDYWESIQESLGDFLRRRGFQEHFAGKHIGDAFSVYGDVQGISRATISVRALARGVRDASRRVAMAYFEGASFSSTAPVEDVESLPWLEMRQRGVIEWFLVADRSGSAEINLVHIDTDQFGAFLVGPERFERALQRMERKGEGHLMVYGVDGPRLRLFVREGWSIAQRGDTFPVSPNDILSLGLDGGGMMEDRVVLTGSMIIDEAVDVTEPFTILYDRRPDADVVAIEYLTQAARLALLEEEEGAAVDAAPEGELAGVEGEETGGEEAGAADEGVAPAPVGEAGNVLPEPAEENVTRSDGEDAAVMTEAAASNGPPLDADGPSGEAATDAAAPTGADAAPSSSLAQEGFDFTVVEEESVLSRTLAETSWTRVVRISLLLSLVMAAFLLKSAALRWVTLAVTLLYLGFMDGGFLSISHITSGIWVGATVYLSDLPLLLMVGFTVVVTLVWGRVFCGFLCPFGALQDFLDRVVPKRLQWRVPPVVHQRGLYVKYAILALILIPAIVGSHASLYQYFEPFGTVFFLSPSVFLWGIAATFLVASAIVPRFYCRYACPLGAALALTSLISLKRIRRVEHCDYCKVCEDACPTGAIRGGDIDFKECVRCNICEIKLIERAGVCRHELDDVVPRLITLGMGTSGGGASPDRSMPRNTFSSD